MSQARVNQSHLGLDHVDVAGGLCNEILGKESNPLVQAASRICSRSISGKLVMLYVQYQLQKQIHKKQSWKILVMNTFIRECHRDWQLHNWISRERSNHDSWD
jgi:hypothetical protein